MATRNLYYGDNIEVLRKFIAPESVDLCYIDPPFNSKRNYNQLYTNVGKEDTALAQAFVDTWTWDDAAELGLHELYTNSTGVFNVQVVDLISGLERILGKGALFAYLVSLTHRIAEIHRVLKPTGSFYLHCDSTASHYLKIVCDAVFCSQGGEFMNEITWKRYAAHSLSKKRFENIADVILFYCKDVNRVQFSSQFGLSTGPELDKRFPHIEGESGRRFQHVALEQSSNKYSAGETRNIDGREVISEVGWRWSQATFDERIAENPHLIYWTKNGRPRYKIYADEYDGKPIGNIWTDIPYLAAGDSERLGYPTQKPEALLERIIQASSKPNDVVLDAYCGCGTTIAVAERLQRQWIGIDITYQSISLMLKRFEETYGASLLNQVAVGGLPRDLESAIALANRQDDRTRKEFEKWCVLTYSNNRAMINTKKGGDGGVDGVAIFAHELKNGNVEYAKAVLSVKSNKSLSPTIVRDLSGTLAKEQAEVGILISLYEMPNLVKASKQYGLYENPFTGGRTFPKMQIVSVQDLLNGARLELPNPTEVVKKAERHLANMLNPTLEFDK
jgi:DNA modification methylase